MPRFALASLLVLAACGGIPDDRPLSDITEEDAEQLCQEFVTDYPGRTVTCDYGEGVTADVEVGFYTDEADCSAEFEPFPESCGATVGDMRDCLDATTSLSDEEVCGNEITIPGACLPIFQCFDLE